MQANVHCPGSPRAGTILLTVREVDPATWNARQERPEGLQIALKRGWDGGASSEGATEAKRKNRSGPGVPFERDPGALPRERGAGLPPHPTAAAGCPDEPETAIKEEKLEETPSEHSNSQGCDPDASHADLGEADVHGPDISADRAAMALLDLRYGGLARRVSLASGDGSHNEPTIEPESASERRSVASVLPKHVPKTDNLSRGISPELLRYALISSRAAIARISSATTLKSLLKRRWKRCCSAEGGCEVCAGRNGASGASSSGAAQAEAGDNCNGSSSAIVPKLKLPAVVHLSKKFHRISKDAASSLTREEKMERLEGIVQMLWMKKAAPMG